MILGENDEILRVICGQVLKVTAAELPKHIMWPVETASATYESFPAESQHNQAWRIKFQDFLDTLPNDTG
jgi:hypothetical protein